MSKKFKIQITMLSDWHIGTGAGIPGSVDKKMMRDSGGFPFIPAKTINGIWRDAMETITQGLDCGMAQGWSKWVETIFGAQPNLLDRSELELRVKNNRKTFSDSLLTIEPANLPVMLRDKINALVTDKDQTNKTKYLNALTFIKPGVAIDGESGSAKPDHLRFEEMGRVGSVLEAEGEFADDNETAWALLVVSAAFIERMGGKRRRGAGSCQWKILDESGKECPVDQAINHLRALENKMPDVPPSQSASYLNNARFATAAAKTDWQCIPYTLELQTPVAIVTATLGNVSESLDFIPGTYLLSPFIKSIPAAQRDDFFQAIAAGNIQILSATIQINGERGVPVPNAFSKHKDGGDFDKNGTIYNRFRDDKSKKQLKPYRNGYISSLADSQQLPAYLNARKTLSMHNVIEDKYQRPTEEVGGVFAREAIAAGTVLRGEIHLTKELYDKFQIEISKAAGKIRLGTSKKDDYGLATLTVTLKKDDPALKCNISTNDKNELIVYLESDLLLRNSNLRQTNLAKDLREYLIEKLGLQLKSEVAFLQTRRIESWQTTWGMPRPTLIAIAAGSCAVFTYDGELAKEKLAVLQKLQASGIGERRGEGYGQIRFNPPLLLKEAQKLNAAVKGENKPVTPPAATGSLTDSIAFAKLLEEVVWRTEIHSAAAKIAASLDRRKEIFGFDSTNKSTSQKPSQSQIGGLRSVISRLKSKTDPDTKVVTGWIEQLQKSDNRANKWPDDVLNEIKKLVTDEKIIWVKLQPEFHLPATLLTDQTTLKTQCWAEAVRTLFHECAHAHKRATETTAKGVGNNG
jgi:CRISPR-associated protein Csx10